MQRLEIQTKQTRSFSIFHWCLKICPWKIEKKQILQPRPAWFMSCYRYCILQHRSRDRPAWQVFMSCHPFCILQHRSRNQPAWQAFMSCYPYCRYGAKVVNLWSASFLSKRVNHDMLNPSILIIWSAAITISYPSGLCLLLCNITLLNIRWGSIRNYMGPHLYQCHDSLISTYNV